MIAGSHGFHLLDESRLLDHLSVSIWEHGQMFSEDLGKCQSVVQCEGLDKGSS